jgi:hypothetical protein
VVADPRGRAGGHLDHDRLGHHFAEHYYAHALLWGDGDPESGNDTETPERPALVTQLVTGRAPGGQAGTLPGATNLLDSAIPFD